MEGVVRLAPPNLLRGGGRATPYFLFFVYLYLYSFIISDVSQYDWCIRDTLTVSNVGRKLTRLIKNVFIFFAYHKKDFDPFFNPKK